jgi:hypothetical protein
MTRPDRHILRRAVAAGEVAAARLIAVDVVDDDAAAFYERYV